MRKRLKITLRSDLCAGNGSYLAASIDLDTALDEYGIPFIPGRRLKGCLRETAEQLRIGQDTLDLLFGISGNDTPGCLSIADARIPSYRDVCAYVADQKISAADVTELYCDTRTATAMDAESGTAKDNSLRTFRVVSSHDYDGRPTVFYSDVCYADEMDGVMQRLAKGLRNIGYHRNRGLGAVSCTLEEDESKKPILPAPNEFPNDNDLYELVLTLRNDGDLMLPSEDASSSGDYVPGTSLLGAFAGAWMRCGESETDFNAVFFNKDVRFGNLYISDGNGTLSYPAPALMNKVKGADEQHKGLYNALAVTDAERQKHTYKPLKGGFISDAGDYLNADLKVTYHNAINGIRLYTQECVTAGQSFTGVVTAPGKVMRRLLPLLKDGRLSVGRSKTAQYAGCAVVKAESRRVSPQAVTVTADKQAVYVLRSDVILCSEAGVYTPTKDALMAALGIEGEIDSKHSVLRLGSVSGYNAKWNLKKPHVPVIRAGSCLVFTPSGKKSLAADIVIGERLNEGFGCVHLFGDAKNDLNGGTSGMTVLNKSRHTDGEGPDAFINAYKVLMRRREMIADVVKHADDTLDLDQTQISRVMRMCREADSYKNFMERIESMKNETNRKKANDWCSSVVGKVSDREWSEEREYLLKCLTVQKYRASIDGKGKEN